MRGRRPRARRVVVVMRLQLVGAKVPLTQRDTGLRAGQMLALCTLGDRASQSTPPSLNMLPHMRMQPAQVYVKCGC